MRLRKKNRGFSSGRTILVLVDCQHGAMEAGRFAMRNLYDSNSRILLQHTYQKPRYGQSMLRNISPVLEKIAKEELTKLKNEMIKEFGLPAGSIGKLVFEGELTSIIRNKFSNTPGLSFVVGFNPNVLSRSFPCRSVIKSVTDSGLGPLFVVSDSITLIDSKHIILFTNDEKEVSSSYLNFLKSLKNNKRMQMTTLTMENAGSFRPTPETALHFSTMEGSRSDDLTGGELLLRKELERISIG
jgi:hypothetical protein